MLAVTVLAVSICVQLAAALLVLRLIRTTGYRLAWALLAAAIGLMAVRRGVPFVSAVFGDGSPLPDLAAESVALVISLLILSGLFAISPIFRAIRRGQELQEAQASLLRTTMESMAEGMSVVDADMRVVGYNRRCLELLELPEELMRRQPSFQEVVRLNAQRGEYGPGDVDTLVRERLELRRERRPQVVERVRPNGTVVEVRSNPIPGGGFVTTYTDITERKRAEHALRESEAMLRSVIGGLPVIIWALDREGVFTMSDGQALEELGLRPGEVVGRSVFDVYRDAPEIVEANRRALAGEFRTTTVATGERVFEAHYSPQRDAEGKVSGVIGIAMDVTARAEAEQNLRESEGRFRNLIMGSLQGILIHRHFQPLFANQALADIFGFESPEEIMGSEGVKQFLAPEELPRLEELHERRLRGENPPSHYEFPGIRKDGTRIWVDHDSRRVDWQGEPAVQSTLVDITERREASENLRQSREAEAQAHARLIDAIESLPTCFALYDAEDRFVLCNENTRKLFPLHAPHLKPGATYQEILRISYETGLIDVPPEEREARIRQRLNEHREKGVVQQQFQDGRWIESYHRPTSEGGTVSIRMDITERRKLEEQLLHAQKMEAVGHLTGGIAHDFNNLLTVILGNLQLLEVEHHGGPAHDLLDNARRAAENGAMLTQRLLAFSRKQALDPVPVDVAGLLEGMTGLLQRTLGETFTVDTHFADSLWLALVDSNQLENCVINLILNARDSMPQGGTIRLAAANAVFAEGDAAPPAGLAAGEYLCLQVHDKGQGMAREVLEHVFEPFFTTKPVGYGSGLGLSMIYGFIRQSGGGVDIHSEPGRGTTVSLYLARAAEPLVTAVEPPPPPGERPVGKGETILVVEDDDAVRRFTVRVLETLGYVPADFPDAPALLAALDGFPGAALLFTDVVLSGGMSGVELAGEVRRRRPALNVLYASGYAEDELMRQMRDDPAAKLIHKPYDIDTLARAVRVAIDRPRSTGRPSGRAEVSA